MSPSRRWPLVVAIMTRPMGKQQPAPRTPTTQRKTAAIEVDDDTRDEDENNEQDDTVDDCSTDTPTDYCSGIAGGHHGSGRVKRHPRILAYRTSPRRTAHQEHGYSPRQRVVA